MDVSAYLRRLGLDTPPRATLDGLRLLQRAHVESVPFENLDVFLGRPLSLEPDDLFDKVVVRRRGGYCFELNALFGRLLAALGFEAVPHLARVWLRDPPEPPPRTHLTHCVALDGRRYLTDVGFGASTPRLPLDIGSGEPIDDGDGPIRVRPDPSFGLMLQRWTDGRWANQYSFEDVPALAIDVRVSNHFVETHPSSHFRAARYVGLFTPHGRDGLADAQYTRRRDGMLDERTVPLGPEWRRLVADRFGLALDLTDAETARLDGMP
jgi:N-hydroxyarylamine O-acetyltransferase